MTQRVTHKGECFVKKNALKLDEKYDSFNYVFLHISPFSAKFISEIT